MAISVTNQKKSQSLQGQAVLVTLDATDAAQLANISEGDLCTVSSSNKTGLVNSVDVFGNSFTISPIQPDKTLESSGIYGYLNSGESISINV